MLEIHIMIGITENQGNAGTFVTSCFLGTVKLAGLHLLQAIIQSVIRGFTHLLPSACALLEKPWLTCPAVHHAFT